MIRADRLTETFLWLTRFDAESYHERKIADALKERFAAMGMTAEEDDAAEALRAEWERSHPESGRPADPSGNLLVRVPGVLPGTPVLFAAHLDTVAPGNGRKAVLHRADEERPDDEEGKEKERPHAGVREDMLTSDGTTVLGGDDGAAIAEILEAVMSLEEEKIPHRELELLFTAAEEPYCRGSRHFDFSRIRAKEAYVVDLDGPAGTASLSAPVIVSFYAEVRGRSAHAGFRPEDGIHAIAAAAAAVSRLPSGRIDADTTFDIGTSAGGTAKNIVPDRVRMEGELRSRSAETAEAFERQAESVFREEAEKAGATAELRWDVNFPSFRVGDDSCIVRRFREACRTIGLKPKTVSTFGGSDNNRLAAAGIPGLVISCGYFNAHTVRETVSVREMVRTAELLEALAR